MRRSIVLMLLALGLLSAPVAGQGAAVSPARATAVAKKVGLCKSAQSWRTARSAVNDSTPVLIKGRVTRAHYAASSHGRPTFLDLGNPYPRRDRVTIVIWGKDRLNFPLRPERMFSRGTSICVMGFVYLFRGTPNIEVTLWDPEEDLLF